MVAESTHCPNCKRPCTIREGLWRKVTCVNSTCRTKFLVRVPDDTEPMANQAEEDPLAKSAFNLWQPSCALPPLRASDPELDSEEEIQPVKRRKKVRSRRERNRIIVCTSVAVVAIPATLLLALFTFFPDFGYQQFIPSEFGGQLQLADTYRPKDSQRSGDANGLSDSPGLINPTGPGASAIAGNSKAMPGSSKGAGETSGSSGSQESKPNGARVARAQAESQTDLDLVRLLNLSYESINVMNTHPDAPASSRLVKDWQLSYNERLEKINYDRSVASSFRAIGEDLQQAVNYLTVQHRESAEVAEAKIRFCESLRNATKNADRVWAIAASGSGSTHASNRFQHTAIKFVKEARTISSLMKGINASNPGNRVAEDMKEFSRRLTEKIAFFSEMPPDSQQDAISLKTIYDSLSRATTTFESIHSIRNNPEKDASTTSEEVSRLVQLFYSDLRLGQELIDLEESVLATWKQQETLARLAGRN